MNDTTTRFCVRLSHNNGMGGRDHSFMVRVDAVDAEQAGELAEARNPGRRAYEILTEEEWGMLG